MSSRSSLSDFSSNTSDRYSSNLTLQTALDLKQIEINVRPIFCGEQDFRLNELRRMTGAIIDLNVVPGTRQPFERVNWTISHPNVEVRDFVLRRINYWMEQTQIICDMTYEDLIFQQEQHEKSIKKAPPPLSTANFGRRNRTRSLTLSSDKNNSQFTDSDSKSINYENIEFNSSDLNQLIEKAKWEGILSDTSDYELNENRVCFADTVAVSKLAELLRNNQLKSIKQIENILQQSNLNVKNREQMKQFNGKCYWFHRIILDGHIQFPVGINQNAYKARQLAYQQMIDVCLNKDGVKMKMLTDNRVKIVKGSKLEDKNSRTNANDSDLNATYISMADLSCLSQCNIVY